MKEIKDLDLNLLKLLQAVVETKNTHAAASQLGISQTSVSRGLAKLREVFGDQLFIRKAHGVEPSELAEKLAEASDEMFTPIIKVVESYRDFEPEEFDGEITIALQIFFLEVYGVGIFDALRKVLPKAKIRLVYWQNDSLAEVINGHVDYLVQFEGYPMPQEIYQHHLNSVKLCLVARKGHPVLEQTSDWESIHRLPLTRVEIDGVNSKRSPIEKLYQSKGYKADVALVTHSVKVLLHKLKASDAILFGSSYMVEIEPELACYPLPKLPKELHHINIVGGYLQTKRGFPLNQLLHQTLQSYFDSVEQPEL
ncbi:LysR family transcriptional regulator [Vibrio barjaei]|jgi:DNA-binding transcriptional LysR family regulator|uniref:LysR family transcriptional regulator n=1 Tax=Vibrio barjaei TaxID=1676683 RepID=UPI0007BB4580|nr:LysR family transcriptional regulator [Vibrio barjaei]OIN28660.1 transcriptional regulator [Vibrio barjaei]